MNKSKPFAVFDARRLNIENESVGTVIVEIRGLWKVSLGLLIVRFGLWIAGIKLEVKQNE